LIQSSTTNFPHPGSILIIRHQTSPGNLHPSERGAIARQGKHRFIIRPMIVLTASRFMEIHAVILSGFSILLPRFSGYTRQHRESSWSDHDQLSPCRYEQAAESAFARKLVRTPMLMRPEFIASRT
jgi:hypothetical protein